MTLTVKKIIIREGSKYTALITNDKQRTIVEVAKAIKFRWREEKGFEQDVIKRGLNDINSYRSELYSPEVIERLGYEKNGVKYADSEECKKLKKERDALKKQIMDTRIDLSRVLENKNLSKKSRDFEYKK